MTELITLGQLQEQQVPWVNHNFGDRPAHMPLLGMGEEFAELIEAFDKLTNDFQSWEYSQRNPGLIKDALADIAVFACDYATAKDWSMEEVELKALEHAKSCRFYDSTARIVFGILLDMGMYIGKMNHHQLKSEQGIRGSATDHSVAGKECMIKLIARLYNLSGFLGFQFPVLYTRVWAEVKKRDWKKDSLTAGTENTDASETI
jgi:hypothetical protein